MLTHIKNLKSKLESLSWLPPLLARIAVGVVFAESGWGKLQNIEGVIGYFTELGIPFPNIQAPFVAGMEFVGGLLLIFGILTRIVTLPLIAIMAVAIWTAKASEISGYSDVFGFSEFLYILLMVWILISGPGPVALDRWINKGKAVL
jgi:putative oxidoreductase